MDDIYTFLSMALKRIYQTKNGNFEEFLSNKLAFETLLSEHKDLKIYAEHSPVVFKQSYGSRKISPLLEE